ncbi:hypothetical protein [Paraburkholderia sp. C35]|uniref:hypothetical protein n=1 Tax=Paraburkholderia sp. C35 TaxID=2126993 RepID=UPI000D69B49C|nr:hypothetical protein [Paraburkholderia sp. C35]
MKAADIENHVSCFRELEMQKVHRIIESVSPVYKRQEHMTTLMHGLNERADAYRASLGVPDDQPEAEAAQEPVEPTQVVSVAPGKKAS